MISYNNEVLEMKGNAIDIMTQSIAVVAAVVKMLDDMPDEIGSTMLQAYDSMLCYAVAGKLEGNMIGGEV